MNYVEVGTVAASATGTRGGGRAALLRAINEVMREGRRGQSEPERIPFFCECQRDDCYEPVWLTADAYDERRTEAKRPLILPGHEHGGPEIQRQRASR